MLIILRVFFGAGFLYGAVQVAENFKRSLEISDLNNVLWVSYCVVVGILNAAIWMPHIRGKIRQPVAAKELQRRPYLRRIPNRAVKSDPVPPPVPPTASPPVSRDPRIQLFEAADPPDRAQETQAAAQVLSRHGIRSDTQRNPEVNRLPMPPDGAVKPDPARLPAPPTASPPVSRDPRIRLFEAADPPDGTQGSLAAAAKVIRPH